MRPFHDPDDRNAGGPHNANSARADIDGGAMDGFVGRRSGAPAQVRRSRRAQLRRQRRRHGIPRRARAFNYWKYARDYVLQDRLFEPNSSWSLPQHLFMVSEWSAWCKQIGDPMSCINELESPDFPPDFRSRNPKFHPPAPGRPDYAWTDLTYLLHARHVSWALLRDGRRPRRTARTIETIAVPLQQKAHTPGIWNPLPYFDTVKADGELGNIRDLREFYAAAKADAARGGVARAGRSI